jgi:hypothetical protein
MVSLLNKEENKIKEPKDKKKEEEEEASNLGLGGK